MLKTSKTRKEIKHTPPPFHQGRREIYYFLILSMEFFLLGALGGLVAPGGTGVGHGGLGPGPR